MFSKIDKIAYVVYVNPRFSESAENVNDLVARFEKYADQLAYLTKNSRKLLLLIGSHSKVVNVNPRLLVEQMGKSSRNPIAFAIRARRSLHSLAVKPSLLIAGDLTFGFFSSFLISRTYFPTIPIQISIHGNQWGFESSKSKNLLQYFLGKYLKIICNNASSVRVVSSGLQRSVTSQLKINEDKILVSPIPILPIPSFIDKRSNPLCIAIVGRFHDERAPLDSIKIILDAFSSMPPCPVMIIGDGPLLDSAKELVETTDYVNYFNFLGLLPKPEILKLWPLINLLISSAEEEGYGLAIREALLSGAVVLCRSNRTTVEFRDNYRNGIFLFEDLRMASATLVELYSNLPKIKLNGSVNEVQRELDQAAVLTLARSWSVG